MSIIRNAGFIPLNDQAAGMTPDVSGAIQNYYQPMVFTVVGKVVEGFVVQETPTNTNFRGVLQPLSNRQLALKTEGQRAWSWFLLHSDLALSLNVDDVVNWRGKQTRVMARKDFSLYGYVQYELVQDWTGSGP